MEKNIGKNTIGDNNKMSVDLKTYNMSTHDLSTVVRNTQAPGTLVPNLTLLVQKGDIIDIDIEANVLTHPTVGPLFGSFKLEHHVIQYLSDYITVGYTTIEQKSAWICHK